MRWEGEQERERDDRNETEREGDSEYNSWTDNIQPTVENQPTRPSAFTYAASSCTQYKHKWHLFQRVLYLKESHKEFTPGPWDERDG